MAHLADLPGQAHPRARQECGGGAARTPAAAARVGRRADRQCHHTPHVAFVQRRHRLSRRLLSAAHAACACQLGGLGLLRRRLPPLPAAQPLLHAAVCIPATARRHVPTAHQQRTPFLSPPLPTSALAASSALPALAALPTLSLTLQPSSLRTRRPQWTRRRRAGRLPRQATPQLLTQPAAQPARSLRTAWALSNA